MHKQNKLLSLTGLFLLGLFLVTNGAICSNSGQIPDQITLKYWRTTDDFTDFSTVIQNYETLYPYVTIEQQFIAPDEYEDRLTDAWIKGEGPDIFSIPNTWLGAYKDYISPMPASAQISTVTTVKRLGKVETIVDTRIDNLLTLAQLKNEFVDVVYKDVVFTDVLDNQAKIYGVPLSIDTLALYFNKDLLNQAQIINPPTTWIEFIEDVKKITAINTAGEVVHAGAALGEADNIPYFADIIALLMMQNGTRMSELGTASFTQASETQAGYIPGVKAVEFYTSFSDPEKETYSWNKDLPDARAQFIQGDLAFFIGYAKDLETIRNEAPNLNFDFTTIPQVNPNVKANYVDYYVETVAQNSLNKSMAWHFIDYLTQETQAQAYVTSAKKPAARKNLLAQQTEDYDLAPWVEQALTAQSWYHGKKPEIINSAFSEMLTSIKAKTATVIEALSRAAGKIELTY